MADRKILIIVEGRDSASGALHSVGGSLGRIGEIAAGILSAQVFERLAAGIINLGRQGLDAIANYERLGMTMQTLAARELLNTGQATDMAGALELAKGQAKELLDWTQKLAIKSPFTQKGVADAFRTAMAYGFTIDQSKRLSQAMINFAAGTGASEETMSRIALALGQIQAKGKLAGQEVLQLVNAGLPVTQILAKAFGVTTAEITRMQAEGLLPAEKVIEAITQSLETDFAGAAERQALSWAGLMGTFADIKEIGLREFFGGIAEVLQPIAIRLSEWLQSDGLIKLREWGNVAGGVASYFVDLAEAFADTGDIFSAEVQESFSSFLPQELQDKFYAFVDGIQAMIERFRPGFEGLWAFWINNGPALSETIEKTFGKLAVIGKDLLDKIMPFLADKLALISAWANDNGPLIQAFAENVGIALVWLGEKLAGLWTVAEPLLSGIIDLVLGLAKTVMQLATGDWEGAWATIQTTLINAALAIWDTLVALVDWILGLFGGSIAQVEEWGRTVSVKVQEIFVKAVEAIRGALERARAFISDFIEVGRNIIHALVSGIKSAAGGVVSALKETVNRAIAEAKKALGIASDSKVFKGIGNNIMTALAHGVEGGISIPVNAVTGAIDSVTTGAMSAAGAGGPGIGGGMAFQFVYAPTFSMADEYEFNNRIAPAIDKFLRERGK